MLRVAKAQLDQQQEEQPEEQPGDVGALGGLREDHVAVRGGRVPRPADHPLRRPPAPKLPGPGRLCSSLDRPS